MVVLLCLTVDYGFIFVTTTQRDKSTVTFLITEIHFLGEGLKFQFQIFLPSDMNTKKSRTVKNS